jgi:hypothetical protein
LGITAIFIPPADGPLPPEDAFGFSHDPHTRNTGASVIRMDHPRMRPPQLEDVLVAAIMTECRPRVTSRELQIDRANLKIDALHRDSDNASAI